MLVVEDDEIVEEYDEFIDIEENLDSNIINLTGITNEMLVDQGVYEDVVADDLKERLTPGTLMVAHNCQFDLSFVYMLLKRHFPEEACEIVNGVDWFDTLTILKDRKKFPHKLSDAVEYCEIDKDIQYHRAIDDTKALYYVTEELKRRDNDLYEYKNLFGFNPKYGVSGIRFNFIKYKPQKFSYIEPLPKEKRLYS